MARSIFDLRQLPIVDPSGVAAGVPVGSLVGVVANANLPSYAAYTPAWTSTGSAPAIGNSTTSAGYIQVGELVRVHGQIKFGSSASYGTGTYSFSLPVSASAAAFSTAIHLHGSALCYDNNTGNGMLAVVRIATATTIRLHYPATYGGTLTEVQATGPFTWAQDDVVSWELCYEAA
jgi:hypothetical protein